MAEIHCLVIKVYKCCVFFWMEKGLDRGILNTRGLIKMIFFFCFEMIFMQPGYIFPFVTRMTHDSYSVEEKRLNMRWAHEPYAGKRMCLRKRSLIFTHSQSVFVFFQM